MGTWALEFDPAKTGSVYKMAYFNGDIFGLCCSGTGSGVWRRTPPTWTRTISGTSRGAVWNDLMFWGVDPAGASRYISRSIDGVNWTVDVDFGVGAYASWMAMGGYGDFLYAAMNAFHGIAGNTFYRRDADGNWMAVPPLLADNNPGRDTVGYGNYVYWCDGGDCYRYRTAWEYEPTLEGDCYYFQVYGGSLFAVASQAVYRLSGGWVEEFSVGGAWGLGDVSLGADGTLWLAAEDGADSRVYYREGGAWMLHSEVTGVRFKSAIAAPDGNLYAGTHSCEFYVYTPTFDLSPAGGGMYPQAMDCDADGGYLYVAVYDPPTGNPVLVRAPLPLADDTLGVGVFAPAAGSAINVKCTGVGGRLAVSGRLSAAGNDSVQTSDDFGATWTDIAPNWGDTAQPLLIDPNTLDQVTVALDGAQDIVETFDGGTLWLTRNAAVGYSPGAAARLPVGDELVMGDDGANRIDYSPSRGQELHDITGTFQGNCQAIEVV